jgi:dTDP-4-dehydrorhamnose reductase
VTLYLTGGAGFVGSNMVRLALTRGHTLFVPVNKTPLQARSGLSTATIDLTDQQAVMDSVEAVQPYAIVHMAFFNDLPQAYEQRHAAWQVMVEATRYLLDAAKTHQIPFIFVSTDWVFDGTQAPANETTPPNPINLYGVLKLVGETLTGQYAKGAVARIAGVFGPHWERQNWQALQNTGFGHLPMAVLQTLQQGKFFDLWTHGGALNRVATPTLASDACEMMLKIIDQQASGIFHCCGAEGLTRQEVAYRTADAFGLDAGLIREVTIDVTQRMGWQGVPVPEDTRLDAGSTASQLGHHCLSFEESLSRLKVELGER